MNQKNIGIIVIIIGILAGIFVFSAHSQYKAVVSDHINNHGTCFLEDGTCLHEQLYNPLYTFGWALITALIILGVYLVYFDKTQQLLAEQNKTIAERMKESAEKDAFKAFLSGFVAEEQRVIKEIYEQEGIKQATLRYRTGMSKTSLSHLVQSLEKRGIVSKKKEGKTNALFLVKKF
ncbi:MAG: helix-turn-helix transcriptional regulator [Candidatus Woesearchaeota archaeon]